MHLGVFPPFFLYHISVVFTLCGKLGLVAPVQKEWLEICLYVGMGYLTTEE